MTLSGGGYCRYKQRCPSQSKAFDSGPVSDFERRIAQIKREKQNRKLSSRFRK